MLKKTIDNKRHWFNCSEIGKRTLIGQLLFTNKNSVKYLFKSVCSNRKLDIINNNIILIAKY